MKKKYKFIDFLKDLRIIAVYFTLVYMWIASSHYLVFNVNVTSGNACFYGGIAILILQIIVKCYEKIRK